MKNLLLKLILSFCFICFHLNEVIAGPGGKIAKVVFDSPVGRIVFVLLVILFLPLIIYNWIKVSFGIRKTRRDIKQLAIVHPQIFDEITLKNRVTDVFLRVHKGWSNENLEECSEYMSDWYWQNQQTVYLDKWKENNLENICIIKRINTIAPLHIRVSNNENYNGSRIMFKIEANMEDYLRNRTSKRIVEGKQGFKDIDTVWTFILENGIWKVDNIEQSEAIIQYIRMENIVPIQQPVQAV